MEPAGLEPAISKLKDSSTRLTSLNFIELDSYYIITFSSQNSHSCNQTKLLNSLKRVKRINVEKVMATCMVNA